MCDDVVATRLARAADLVEIQQLPVRYAQAIDARDIDALTDLWVPDVWMGKAHGAGARGVRHFFEPVLAGFYRSIHMIVGHKVDFVDDNHASGVVYCRAEHESGGDWVVQAIVYADHYERVDNRWAFVKRRHHHWYSAPIDEPPAPPAFENWPLHPGQPPDLPHIWPSWETFWGRAGQGAIAATTSAPAAPVAAPASPRVTIVERLEINELAARYGNVVDDRDWDRLDSVFTSDAVFELHGFPVSDLRFDGLAAIREFMTGSRHPVAHHVTNVEIDVSSDGVGLRSKVMGSGHRGRVGSADYRDRLRKTEHGWRIAHRVVSLRRPEA
jgi:ketosteroid isomerase-like protein